MIKYMKKLSILLLTLLMVTTACENFLDINDDPNNPTKPQINQLLPGILYDIADDFNYYPEKPGYICATYMHQLV